MFLLSCLHSAAGYLDKCRGIKHHEGDGRTCLGCPGGTVLQYKAVAVGNGGRLVGTGTLKRDVTSLIIGCQSADGGNGVCAFTTIGDCITVVGGFNGKCRCVSRVSRCRSTDNIAGKKQQMPEGETTHTEETGPHDDVEKPETAPADNSAEELKQVLEEAEARAEEAEQRADEAEEARDEAEARARETEQALEEEKKKEPAKETPEKSKSKRNTRKSTGTTSSTRKSK